MPTDEPTRDGPQISGKQTLLHSRLACLALACALDGRGDEHPGSPSDVRERRPDQ